MNRPLKVLVIAVIKKGESVLMRKKPDGSPPYKETWYLFGAELTADVAAEKALKEHLKSQAGILVKMGQQFSWDTEVKDDLDGVEKCFVYLDVICDYVDGELSPGPGIEKLEWAQLDELKDYDLVPPSVEVFKKLGYL